MMTTLARAGMALACLLVCSLFPALVWAVPVPIVNPSFESAVAVPGNIAAATGWTLSGTGGGGVWNYAPYGTTYFDVAPPDGIQVGYLSIGPVPGSAATLEQTVGVVQSRTIYTLTGYFGHPKTSTFGAGTDFTAELVAGGVNVLAGMTANGPVGNFEQFTVTFNSTDSAFVGAPLSIRLTSNKAQTEFDLISLDAANAAPEPSGFLLLGLGLLALRPARLRARQVALV